MKKSQDEKKSKYYSVVSSYKKLMSDAKLQLDENIFMYIKDRIIRIENTDFDFSRTFSIMNPQDKGKQLYGLENLLNAEFHLTNYKNINRINEIDFRYLNGKDLNDEYKNMDEFIEYWYSIARDFAHRPIQARLLAEFNLAFLCFRDSIGNPFMWSSKIYYDNTFFNPFHAVNCNEYIYFVAVLFGEINPEIKKCEELDILVYNPEDLHLELLSNAMDEILVKINFLFDYNFYTFLDKNKLHKILDELNDMNEAINEFVRENISDVSRETLNILTTILDSRVSRDTYFKSLYFLTNKKSISDTIINKYPTACESYHINSFDKYTKGFLSDYCNEIDDKTASVQLRTFNKNLKLLKTYEKAIEGFPLKCPYHIFKTDLNNLLDLKVLYHEFIVDKAEHVNEKAKIKSKINIGIDSILKRIITTVDSKNNFLSNEDKMIYCANELYTDNTYFDLDQNEDSNIIYKTNLLLSEKIRRGYYREFKLLDNYKLIFDYKIKLRETLTNIFRINDIDKMFYIVLSLYIELSNYFNELQESTKNYK